MKMTRMAAAGLVGVSLAIGGLAGCGSSGSDAAAPASTAATATADGANAEPRMTVAAYRETANKVCRTVLAKSKAIPQPTDAAGFPAYVKEVAAVAQDGVDGLSGLYPPADLDAAHQKLIAAEQKGVDVFTQISASLPDPATEADVQAAAAKINGADATAIRADVKAAALDLGLTACGANGGASDSADDAGD